MAQEIHTQLSHSMLAALGLACIEIDQRGDECRLSISDSTARKRPGHRLWFRSPREAERILTRLLNACELSRRVRGDIVVSTDVDTTEQLVRSSARAIAVTPIENTYVEEMFAGITKRVTEAIAKMRAKGVLRLLSKQYQAERQAAAASGMPAPPKHDLWLVKRLEEKLSQFDRVSFQI